MKNVKNGFTLVEILSVIVILGLIALITIPVVLNNIKSTKDDLYNTQINLIKAGAVNYVTDVIAHPSVNVTLSNMIKPGNPFSTAVSLTDLQNSGAVELNISNPLCDGENKYFSPTDTIIKISYDGKEFDYEVASETNNLRGSCTEKIKKNGE